MPQKFFGEFNGTLKIIRLKEIDKHIYISIENNEDLTQEIKFLNSLSNESTRLAIDIQNGYDITLNKFEQLLIEIKARSNRTSDSSSRLSNDSTNALSSNKNNQNKKDKFELLAQKFKTPIDSRTKTCILTNQNESIVVKTKKASIGTKNNSRKRSAQLAEISIGNDEHKDGEKLAIDKNLNEPDVDDEEKVVKKKGTKSKKKKKQKQTIHNDNDTEKEKLDSDQNNKDTIATETKESKNPSKKVKLSKKKAEEEEEDCVEIMDITLKEETNNFETQKKNIKKSVKKQSSDQQMIETSMMTKVKKKKKISKQTSTLSTTSAETNSVDLISTATTPSNKKVLINNSIRNSSIKKKSLLPHYIKNIHNPSKTPSNPNRLSRITFINSTIKKSVMKPKILTRAARAAAEATTTTVGNNAVTSKLAVATSTSTSVSKIPNKNSALDLNKPSNLSNVRTLTNKFNSIATPNKNHRLSNIQNTITKLKTLRNSIDKRKEMTSKGGTIKKSLVTKEKALAFLTSEQQQNRINEKHKDEHNSTSPSANIVIDDSLCDNKTKKKSIKISDETVANINSSEDEEMINDIKTRIPKICIAKIPNNICNSDNLSVSATKATKIMNDAQKTITQTISMSSIKTPAKPFNQTSLTNLQTSVQKSSNNLTIKSSFMKFLERNTPSKMTKTELDEKRRAELLCKDNKEKERMQELERQKNEKREEARKIREERIKKAAEQKLQREIEFKQKAESKKAEEEAKLAELKNKNTSIAHASMHNSHALPPIKRIPPPQTSTALQPLTNRMINGPNDSIVSYKPQPQQQTQPQKKASILTPEELSEFKKSILLFKQTNNITQQPTIQKTNLETTYILSSPSSGSSASSTTNNKKDNQQSLLKASFSNYEVTPLQPLKLKNEDNYDVSDLQSADETDDEEEPSKPLPTWAKEPFLSDKAKSQNLKMINFTKLFKGASRNEIVLEDIFRIKRKKFTERSSSAIWETPPVWATGLNGEESFYRIRKDF